MQPLLVRFMLVGSWVHLTKGYVMANAIFGSNTTKSALWLDMWGISKTLEQHKTSNGDLLDQAEIAHRLSIFVSYLAVLANAKPNLEIAQGSDGAFIIGDDPNEVLGAGILAFQNISFVRHQFLFLPIRGGVSKNLVEVVSNKAALAKIQNFSYLPYLGEGFAKAFKMETFGRKGMRLFVTESLRDRLADKTMIAPNAEARGVSILKEPTEPYFEVRWMEPNYLTVVIDGKPVEEHYKALAGVWKNGDEFKVEMARSLEDQMEWANTGVQNKTW